MPFAWFESLAVDNGTIDEQHKQLIKIFNDFMDACINNRAEKELDKSLNFLVDYVAKHFSDEEGIHFKTAYPAYAGHKKIHDGFRAKVGELVKKLKEEGPSQTMMNTLNFEVGTWIMDHIAKEDKKFGEFLRSKKTA